MSDSNTARVTISEVPLKADQPSVHEEAAARLRAQPSFTADAWQVITLSSRLDAFNHTELVQAIHEALAEGAKRIALDLTPNKFFSLNAIQFCTSIARDLAYDGGYLALIGCAERTRRHFDIYGSTKQVRFVRSMDELAMDSGASINIRPRAISPEAL